MIIDGKKISEEIQEEIRKKVSQLKSRPPCLAVILVGEHPASTLYVKRKIEACKSVGIQSLKIALPESISKTELLAHIDQLNQDAGVDGILVQLPLPQSINPLEVTERIFPAKDVDGLHPLNMGKLLMGEKGGFIPCTPLGIQTLLLRSGFDPKGKHAVVIGRSSIVGKPMAALLMQAREGGNATVTLMHSHSQNVKDICQTADLIITAIGKPRFLTVDMVKKGAVVIDVGINRIEENGKYKIVGDADFVNLINHCQAITPVPGGVGPMTIAMLLANTLKSYLS